jgi:cell division protein FtsB
MSKSPGNDPVAAEIQAEIADHLATAAEKLQSQGLPTVEAREKSQAKFGDADLIGRRCYWIKQGDALMFRTAIIVLLSLLCCALGLVAFNGYRSQRHMAEQMAALAAELKALAQQRNVPATIPEPPPEPQPLKIKGHVYLGTRDKPASNWEVMVCQAFNGEPIRRLTTSANGAFDSDQIAPGDYTLIVNQTGMGQGGRAARGVSTQTKPIYVYPATPQVDLAIDALFRTGAITVELSRPLPKIEVPGKFTIDSRLCLALSSNAVRLNRWNTTQPMPDHWPIYLKSSVRSPYAILTKENNQTGAPRIFRSVLSNADIEAGATGVLFDGEKVIPAGPCTISATMVADVLPHDFLSVPSRVKLRESSRDPREVEDWLSPEYVLRESMGAVLMGKLSGMKIQNSYELNTYATSPQAAFRLNSETIQEIAISDSGLTRLRVELPSDIDNLETEITELVSSAKEPSDVINALRMHNPFIRHAKITVLHADPLANQATLSSHEPNLPAL